MTQFVEVKTSELSGAALDWAVAKATQKECKVARFVAFGNVNICVEAGLGESLAMQRGPFCPSTNWAHGGPLLDKYPWALPYKTAPVRHHLGEFEACTESGKACNGETPLIAACRIIVAAMLGGVVQVPAELVGVAA